MWSLPRAGIEPESPALEGGFTSEPPGKPGQASGTVLTSLCSPGTRCPASSPAAWARSSVGFISTQEHCPTQGPAPWFLLCLWPGWKSPEIESSPGTSFFTSRVLEVVLLRVSPGKRSQSTPQTCVVWRSSPAHLGCDSHTGCGFWWPFYTLLVTMETECMDRALGWSILIVGQFFFFFWDYSQDFVWFKKKTALEWLLYVH